MVDQSKNSFLQFIAVFDQQFIKTKPPTQNLNSTIKSPISKSEITETFKQISKAFTETLTLQLGKDIFSEISMQLSVSEVFSNEKFFITKRNRFEFMQYLVALMLPSCPEKTEDWFKIFVMCLKDNFTENDLVDVIRCCMASKDKKYWLNQYEKTNLESFYLENRESLDFDDYFFILTDKYEEIYEKSDLLFKLICFIQSPAKLINNIDSAFDEIGLYLLPNDFKAALEYFKHSKRFEFYISEYLDCGNTLIYDYLIERFPQKFLPLQSSPLKNSFFRVKTLFDTILQKYVNLLFESQNLQKIFELSTRFDILTENVIIYILKNKVQISYEKIDLYSQKLYLIEKLRNVNYLLEEELVVMISDIDGFVLDYLVEVVDESRLSDLVVAQLFLRNEVDKVRLVSKLKRGFRSNLK